MTVLSVIIPTYNRSQWLVGCLESLLAQTYTCMEIIVVDNGSTDDTRAVFERYRGDFNRAKYCFEETPGLHAGRHRGMREAAGDILVFADDDIEAFPTWLEGIEEAFSDGRVALVGGKNLPKFESEPPSWILERWREQPDGTRILGYLSILDLGDRVHETDPRNVFGCNFSIRREVLLDAGGFHPDSMPRDLILYRGDGETHVSDYVGANGHACVYNPKASVYHCVPESRLTQAYFEKRAFNQGVSASYAAFRAAGGFGAAADGGTFVRRLLRKARRLAGKALHSGDAVPEPGSGIDGIIQEAYARGYRFHRAALEASDELCRWVLRDDYLNTQGEVI